MKTYDPNQTTQDTECGLCGRDGGPLSSCQTCHGAGGTQPRAYSLSDIRSGRVSPDVLNNGRTPGSAPKEYNQGDSQ